MVRLLEDRLEEQTKTLKDTQKAARCLEELLFRSAPSMKTYQDLSTLKRRVSVILIIQVQSRLYKSCKRIAPVTCAKKIDCVVISLHIQCLLDPTLRLTL